MSSAVDFSAVRTRKDRETTMVSVSPGYSTPTSFVLATEGMLGKVNSNAASNHDEIPVSLENLQVPGELRRADHSNNCRDDDEHEDRLCSNLQPVVHNALPENTELAQRPWSKENSSAYLGPRRSSLLSTSDSLTSLSQASQLQGISSPNSPKSTSTRSVRPSDDESGDETASQAVISSGEDENELPSDVQDSSPQLIMPSIKIPSRRPFTERGKAIGRLKILVAGESGVGKTSLIKSIVQICEDIVHVDPLTPTLPSLAQLRPHKPKSKQQKFSGQSTREITEVYASTRAYPPWWSDLDDSKILRRRKSVGDTVLERNLCFVDTPGLSHYQSPKDAVEAVAQYAEAQFGRTSLIGQTSSSDLVSVLSGRGGTQVDVALYLISEGMKTIDLDFIKRLSVFTNVIPLIAKADTLSAEAITKLKAAINEGLQSAGTKTFAFQPNDGLTSKAYTVCSALSNDDENMDASLLMSPDYVQPLVSSELSELVPFLFDIDNISWLRHLAAKKLVFFQRDINFSPMPNSFPRSSLIPNVESSDPSAFEISSPSSPVSHTLVSYSSGASSYVQAKLADHRQREEKLAQIRLAKWAGDLQRCLHNERNKYEALARGERTLWLTQRLGECESEGSLIPIHDRTPPIAVHKGRHSTRTGSMDYLIDLSLTKARDPLGLFKLDEALREKGWVAFQILGGFGILGAMAIWATRSWGAGSEIYPGWSWSRWGR